MSEHDKLALAEIRVWKDKKRLQLNAVLRIVNHPFARASETFVRSSRAGLIIEKALIEIVGQANNLAQWSLRPDTVLEDFRRKGYPFVRRREDLHFLDLQVIDTVTSRLAAKYIGLALLEGGAAGTAGLPGLPIDLVALVTLNLRAIGEFATYCGFDLTEPYERLYALNVLGLAASPNESARRIAMAQLVKIAKEITKRVVVPRLEGRAFMYAVRQVSRSLGIRLAKAKTAQLVPVAGAAIAGTFNAWQMAQVCTAASYLYRERFLAAKYGDEIFDIIGSQT